MKENKSLENLEGETWKDIEGWEGYYQASNMGRVKSFGRTVIFGNNIRHTKDKILKPSKRPDNYYVVWLTKDERKEIHNLHRLIAEVFIHNDDPINKNDVDHKDGNSLNNRVENLRWTTRKENLNNRKRKRQGGSKKIICITTGEIFNTLKEAGEKYDLAYYNISSCCKGYSKTCGELETGEKLVWRYYKDYIK